jgi:hypothetical protein
MGVGPMRVLGLCILMCEYKPGDGPIYRLWSPKQKSAEMVHDIRNGNYAIHIDGR